MRRWIVVVFVAALSIPVFAQTSTRTTAKVQSPDVVEGKLEMALGFSLEGGASSPKLWIESDGPQKSGGWACAHRVICFVVVLTEKTVLPPSWGHGDSFHVDLVKSGRYSVRGKISGKQIAASEIKFLGTVPALTQSTTAPSAADNQSQQNTQKVTISASEAESLLLMKTSPLYPPTAKDAGISGTVVLKVEISKEGTVQKPQFISGHSLLAQAAIDAVKQWRYKPYLVKGEPVAVETTVNVVFAPGG